MCEDFSSDDYDNGGSYMWKKKFKQETFNLSRLESNMKTETPAKQDLLAARYKKFEELRKKSNEIKEASARRRLKTEKRRSQKLIKKALRDPSVKELVDANGVTSFSEITKQERENTEALKWKDVKPFLSVNDHLTIPSVSCGPKTELESLIEDAITRGDFEKAELLSDTLADRQFAVKIAQAFSAKRCHDKLEQEKAAEKVKQMKKIRWMFDAKERWQMKGNM